MNGNTPLHIAAKMGHLSVVTGLLEMGAPLEARNNDEETSLHLAVKEGHEEIVKHLLEAGSSVESRNCKGMTVFHLAAAIGSRNILTILQNHITNILENEKNIKECSHNLGGSKSVSAISNNDSEKLTELPFVQNTEFDESIVGKLERNIKENVSVSTINDRRKVAELKNKRISKAIDSEKSAKKLLESDEAATIRDEERKFMGIRRIRNIEISKRILLMPDGVFIKIYEFIYLNFPFALSRYDVIHKRSKIQKNLEKQAEFLNFVYRTKDLDNSLFSQGSATQLHYAAIVGAVDAVCILIRQGHDLNAVDNNGCTPVELAVSFGWLNVMIMLLEAGAKSSNAGRNLLHVAVLNSQVDCSKELLKKKYKLNPNWKSEKNQDTPLHLASFCTNQAVDVAETLIEHGAKVFMKNKLDLTPLEMARLTSHLELSTFLSLIEKKERNILR